MYDIGKWVLGVSVLAVLLLAAPVQAQESRTFGTGKIDVRLCPKTCIPVTGHGFKAGSKVKVLESRAGWARVSERMGRLKLIRKFGLGKVPRNPALWVPVASFASLEKPKEAVKKSRSGLSLEQLAARGRLAVPRPRGYDSTVEAAEGATEQPVATDQNEVAEVATTPATATPATEADGTKENATEEVAALEPKTTVDPVQSVETEEPDPAAEIEKPVDIISTTKVDATAPAAQPTVKKDQSWEAVQAAIAAQKAKLSQSDAQREATEAADLEKAKKAAQIAEKEEQTRLASQKLRDAKAKEIADQKAAEQQAKLEEEAQKEIEAKKAAEAAAPKAEPVQTAKVETSNDQKVAKDVKPEPTYTSAKMSSFSVGPRPDKMTKALLDKRLKSLPGPKTRGVKKEEVIALRHFALGLLESKECQGIAGGGRSPSAPGMLFVACSEDPGYFRQFPLEEQSW